MESSGDSYSSSSVSSEEHSTEDNMGRRQGTQPYLFETYDREASSGTDSTSSDSFVAQMNPMKNNLNDCKAQTGKRSIYFFLPPVIL